MKPRDIELYPASGFFLDIGANDGIKNNKTLRLQKKGWAGLCVEASPRIYSRLLKNRSSDIVLCMNECLVSEKNSKKIIKFFDGDQSGLANGIIPNKNFSNHDDFRWKNKDKIDDFCTTTGQDKNIIEIEAKSLYEILEWTEAPRIINYAKFDIEGAEFSFFRISIDVYRDRAGYKKNL